MEHHTPTMSFGNLPFVLGVDREATLSETKAMMATGRIGTGRL